MFTLRQDQPFVPANDMLYGRGHATKANLFRAGLWLLAVSIPASGYHGRDIWVGAPIMIVGMLLLLVAVSLDWQRHFIQLGRSHRCILVLLALWGLLTISRGMLDLRWLSIRGVVGLRSGGWAWLVPLLIPLGMDLAILRRLIRDMMYQGCLGAASYFFFLFATGATWMHYNLTWGCPAALLFWYYLPKWGRRCMLAGAFVEVFYAVLISSRNTVLGQGILLIAAGFIEMRRRQSNSAQRQLKRMALYGLLLGVVYYVATHDQLPGVGDFVNTRIEEFKGEVTPDTILESRVNEKGNLYTEFFDDMSIRELLIGRGALGTYHDPRVGQRINIECGYLFVILKGGAIMLILMLGLAVPAVWLGLFRSRNWLIKGFAFVVVGWLVEMVPFALPGASPRYLLFWMAIGACLNPRLRMLTDHELENILLGWRRSAVGARPATRAGDRMGPLATI